VSKKIKSITNPRLNLKVLRAEDIRRIHETTLEIVETIGVKFPSPRALDIWEAHGARVDRGTQIVKIPAALIESALRSAPPVFTLAARDPSQDLPLDGNHVYVGTDGCGIEVIDIATGLKRRSTVRDVADIARVADDLEEVAFHWVPVSAQDCPPETRGLHEILAIWSNSTKHVQTESIYSGREARAAVEMASVLAGGRDALRKRPLLSIMECTISPLAQDSGSLEAALVGAEAGCPVGFMTMASCCSTGPATMAGNLALGNAEVLSALALIQLAFPGAPVYYASAPTVMDLRSGAYTGGGPEDFLFGAASNELADFYNLPLSMGSFATGAKEPGWQAGLENGLSTFEQMIMDCEIFSIVRKMMEGIPVDAETLALEAIREAGPGGDFLTHDHTLRNMRGLWITTLLDRRPYTVWESKRNGARDWARDKAKAILATHHPVPLEPKLEAELRKIIQSAGV